MIYREPRAVSREEAARIFASGNPKEVNEPPHNSVRARSIEFKLMNVSKFVAWVLEVTRLNSVFEVMYGAELYFASRSQAEPMTLAACA